MLTGEHGPVVPVWYVNRSLSYDVEMVQKERETNNQSQSRNPGLESRDDLTERYQGDKLLLEPKSTVRIEYNPVKRTTNH